MIEKRKQKEMDYKGSLPCQEWSWKWLKAKEMLKRTGELTVCFLKVQTIDLQVKHQEEKKKNGY